MVELAILKKPPFFFSPGGPAGDAPGADSGILPDAGVDEAGVDVGILPPVAFSILSNSFCSRFFSFSRRLFISSALFLIDRDCIATSFFRLAWLWPYDKRCSSH